MEEDSGIALFVLQHFVEDDCDSGFDADLDIKEGETQLVDRSYNGED